VNVIDPTPSITPAPAESVCPESGVRISTPDGDAAMGLRLLDLELENCGTQPFQVKGYPALRLLDEDHQPVQVKIGPGTNGVTTDEVFDAPARQVTLQPGEKAKSGLVWRNTYDDTTSPPVVGVYLEISPVAGRPVQLIKPTRPSGDGKFTSVTIDLGSTGKLGVAPWAKA
jgi:uncharacterized protein DUF4232